MEQNLLSKFLLTLKSLRGFLIGCALRHYQQLINSSKINNRVQAFEVASLLFFEPNTRFNAETGKLKSNDCYCISFVLNCTNHSFCRKGQDISDIYHPMFLVRKDDLWIIETNNCPFIFQDVVIRLVYHKCLPNL